MYVVTIKTDDCTGCEACITSCPMEMFEMTGNGEKKSKWKGNGVDECIACEACVSACETGAIEVKEQD